jgi:hypothetical protein
MSAGVHKSKHPPSECLPRRLLCTAIIAVAVSASWSATSALGSPPPPSIGQASEENLSIGVPWGLYEEAGSQQQDSIGIVGAPTPFIMQLTDDGENRLFIFVQRRAPGRPYCAETPAQMEGVSDHLTAAAGDPTIPGPAYSKTYLWVPTETGEYALCTYLDATPDAHPVAINFLKLAADPAPSSLSIAVASEAETPERNAVKVEGAAVVRSELTASVQEQGLPCTLPEGELAGSPLSLPSGGALGPGPFVASFDFATAKPGKYEVCAYLVPESSTGMFYWRPYEVGRADFAVANTQAVDYTEQDPAPTAARPPVLSAVAMSNTRFRVASGGAHSASGVPLGTKFRFAVSAPATMTIAISRLLPGVRQGRRCTRRETGGETSNERRCVRSFGIGSIVRRLPVGGRAAIVFQGIVNKRRLVPGAYSATVTANNRHGRSSSVGLRFSVAR